MNLRTKLTISINDLTNNYEHLTEDEVEEAIGDYISELTGFCHKGFVYEIKGNDILVSKIKWDTRDS